MKIKFKIIKRIKNGNTYRVLVQNHPNANKHGYVLEHRVKMENHLGRLLTKNELVHHINHNPLDNRIKNLKVVSYKEHRSYHGKKATIVDLICGYCHNPFKRAYRQIVSKIKKGQKIFFCSKKCADNHHKIPIQYLTIFCDYCNGKFKITKNEFNHRKNTNKYGMFCSMKCGSRKTQEHNQQNKLTPNKVREIRKLFLSNKCFETIAKKFKISVSEIRRVINKKRWGYVK